MEMQTMLRIYVGGLGETVTEEDLRSTFSKSGMVETVEIVRTKCRSFAYIDFLPSSDKSVAKLFSTYNGCAWKGGKLRLEKAKVHYLERLKREWEEDADLASKTHDDDAKNMVSSVGLEEAFDESTQIHMFFPKLRKVKSLPYKGTGKHKYSFQRVQASALPVHFCDCVEHAGNINTIKETQIGHASVVDGGMNKNEINMMNSVLNKFLKREPHSSALCMSSQAKVAPADHLPDDQNHNDDSTDDDNIIINAMAGPNDMSRLLQSMKKQTGLHTKMGRSKKLQNSAGVNSRNNVRIQKGKVNNSMKQDKLVRVEGSEKKVVKFSIPNRKQTRINQSEQQSESLRKEEESGHKQSVGNTLQKRGQGVERDDRLSLSPSMKLRVSNNEPQPVSNVVKDGMVDPESHPPKQLNEASNTDPKNIASDKPAKGTSWIQLVSSANNSSFSISQILPQIKVSKKSTQTSSGQRTGISDSSNRFAFKRKRENTGEGLDSGKEDLVAATSEDINMQGRGNKKQKLDIQQSAAPDSNLLGKATYNNESNHASTSANKLNSQEKKTFDSSLSISATCPFMRTDSSMEDWKKIKTALKKKK